MGLTGGDFKTRYRNHTASFRNKNTQNETELPKYIWRLKDEGVEYTLKWKIIDRSNGYSQKKISCQLCIKEKWYIIFKPEIATLNDRSEWKSHCRHKKQHLLCNL